MGDLNKIRNLKILNKKEIKEILAMIKEHYDAEPDLDYVFILNESDNKIYITNRDLEKIDLEKIRINLIGLYIAEINHGFIRLSIEGSQLIGPYAKKNILELDEKQMKAWMRGEDLDATGDYSGFVIIKYGNDFLGSGKYSNGRILNYVNKARRVNI